MKSESASELKRVITNSLAFLESLIAINRKVKSWDDLLVHIISERLDSNVRKDWKKSLGNSTEPQHLID